jgi:hypothetical protein
MLLRQLRLMYQEAKNNNGGKASHAAWRNYDDFNEFFWSRRCFVLDWPWRADAGFFMKPRKKGVAPIEVRNCSKNLFDCVAVVLLWSLWSSQLYDYRYVVTSRGLM